MMTFLLSGQINQPDLAAHLARRTTTYHQSNGTLTVRYNATLLSSSFSVLEVIERSRVSQLLLRGICTRAGLETIIGYRGLFVADIYHAQSDKILVKP